MSHIPGPWFQNLSDKLQILADDPRKTIICRVSGAVSNPSAIADASLIAAAPDLLEALEDVLDRLGALSNRNELLSLMDKEDAERVFAAIKKARGQ